MLIDYVLDVRLRFPLCPQDNNLRSQALAGLSEL